MEGKRGGFASNGHTKNNHECAAGKAERDYANTPFND